MSRKVVPPGGQGRTPDERGSYRRGYQDGFTRALESLWKHLDKHSCLPIVGDALVSCFAFADKEFEAWISNNLKSDIDPPVPDLDNP